MIQTQDIKENGIYTQKEVCKILGICENTLRKMRSLPTSMGGIKFHVAKMNKRPFYYGRDIIQYANNKMI